MKVCILCLAIFLTSFQGVFGFRMPSTMSSSLKQQPYVPESVNYHFTRRCNYRCGFCFHTSLTGQHLPLDEAKRGLGLLAAAGMKKLNFAGGEPFLLEKGRYLGELVKFCKKDLKVESVSIISNGSLITEAWFKEYAECLDIMGLSCDSFNGDTNIKIGRHTGGKVLYFSDVARVRTWCSTYGVPFKLNTVVNSANVHEDMSAEVEALAPVRWKIFQALSIEGENAGTGALRDVDPFLVSDEQFRAYIDRHSTEKCKQVMRIEDNTTMRDSYLLVDEFMRFLDCADGGKRPTASILDVGVSAALSDAGFNRDMYMQRGGQYAWTKEELARAADAIW